MNAAKVEMCDGECNRMFEIIQLLGISQCEAREAPVKQAQAQMGAVNVGRADSVQPRKAKHGAFENLPDPAWHVSSFRRI